MPRHSMIVSQALTPEVRPHTGRSPFMIKDIRWTRAWKNTRAKVIREQPWCSDCGIEGDPNTGRTANPRNPLTADHIVPLAHGGDPISRDNLRTLCLSCNSRRGQALRFPRGGRIFEPSQRTSRPVHSSLPALPEARTSRVW